MGKLIVVRHGQTEYNVQKRFTGSTDIPINSMGKNQALETMEKIKNQKIDVIYSSTLLRAKQTAEIINGLFSCPVIYREELKELCMGVFEGLTKEEIIERYPQMWANKNPDGAENYEQVMYRVAVVLEEIKEKYKDKTVLIVTHGLITKVIYKYFENPTEEEFNRFLPDNCEATYFMF